MIKRDYTTDCIIDTGNKVLFTSPVFYWKIFVVFLTGGLHARNPQYSGDDWVYDSKRVMQAMHDVGIPLYIEGTENLKFEGPCVFESNHMSTLETLTLPAIIQPVKDVTFVSKRSLMKYPCFRNILASRNPILVDRVSPREDFIKVMEQGKKHLANGRSVIIFSQSTRKHRTKKEEFNTLAVKLSRDSGVPVVPIALKTDAWSDGKILNDFGWIRPKYPVRFRFGKPIFIQKNGKEEHGIITDFICNTFNEWIKQDGSAYPED